MKKAPSIMMARHTAASDVIRANPFVSTRFAEWLEKVTETKLPK
jgi:hypothetical protein